MEGKETTDGLINSTNVLLIVLSYFWLPTLHEEEHPNVELLSSDDTGTAVGTRHSKAMSKVNCINCMNRPSTKTLRSRTWRMMGECGGGNSFL